MSVCLSVCRRSQTEGRNYCSIVSGDVSKLIVSSGSTSCHEFASQFGIAVCLYAKHFQILGEIGWLARVVYFNDPATGYECQRNGPSRVGAYE